MKSLCEFSSTRLKMFIESEIGKKDQAQQLKYQTMKIPTNVVPSLKREKAEIQGGELNYMELA